MAPPWDTSIALMPIKLMTNGVGVSTSEEGERGEREEKESERNGRRKGQDSHLTRIYLDILRSQKESDGG